MAELAPNNATNGAQLAATEAPRRIVPLVCHGHTRPVTHLCFTLIKNGNYHLVSSSKDGVPMFRDGRTGDWQGSWMGHQGAIWCARPSNDGTRAASASADFTARVWDAATGELLYTLNNKHVVRAVDFCPSSNDLLITASNDGVLRLWNLALIGEPKSDAPNGVRDPVEGDWEKGRNQYVFTIGQHQQTNLKFALWLGSSTDRISRSIVTAQGKRLFWWDLQDIGPNDDAKPWKEHSFDNEITCCEKFDLDPSYAEPTDIGGGKQVFGVAAGKTVVFWGGEKCGELLKQFDLDWRVSSIAIDVKNRKFLAGQADSTWVVMLDWDTAKEEQVFKSHHGPIHSMSFSPDNKVFATGSEDGTVRIWKNCEEDYGLWQSKRLES